jgi:hypothetical protein
LTYIVTNVPRIRGYSEPSFKKEIKTISERSKLVIREENLGDNIVAHPLSSFVGLLFSIELVQTNEPIHKDVHAALNWTIQNKFIGLMYDYNNEKTTIWFERTELEKEMNDEKFSLFLNFIMYNELYLRYKNY